jgi:hypothetical protein
MKTFLNGQGQDVSATVLAYQQAGNQFQFADLVLIGEFEESTAVWLTDWETDLVYSVYGTFKKTVMKRGKVTAQIGLDVASLTFTWSPQPGTAGTTIATASPYQLAQAGFYDNRKFRLWRAVMPTPGDVNTYGACEWFGGWIGKTDVGRGSIAFTVNSFLNMINQKLPPNVIEATNTLAGYAGATPVLADSETQIPRFQVVAPTSADMIVAECLSPTANKIYSNNKLQYGYMVFEKGTTLAGFWSAIGSNSNYNAGGGVHYNQINVYSPFPWTPTPGDTFYVATQFPINQQDGSYIGFPYVPAPEQAF